MTDITTSTTLPRSNYRVLLVDDELHILRAAEYKLSRHGFEVTCASNGEIAWSYLQSNLPDVVVTDLQMPRMSGLELIERIRSSADHAHLPVLMLTAKGFEIPKREIAERWNVFEVICKPFSPRELCEFVQRAIDQQLRHDVRLEPASENV